MTVPRQRWDGYLGKRREIKIPRTERGRHSAVWAPAVPCRAGGPASLSPPGGGSTVGSAGRIFVSELEVGRSSWKLRS